jgi:fermentation-respiration switch protein FrsA (DUF1100 family)
MAADTGKLIRNVVAMAGLFVVTSLSILYFNQEKLLYLPAVPIKHTRDNPIGYRSPMERQMRY